MNVQHIHDELHIKDYASILRRRRGVAILFFVTVVVIVTLGSLIIRPVYRASVTLLIDTESPDVLTTTGMVSLESQNYFSYKEYYQSQKEIITSRSIVKKVFEEYGLGETEDYKKAKEPIEKFLKTIKVEPVRDTRLLRLNVDNRDPVLAANIANHIAEIYVKRNLYYISKDELSNLIKNEYLKLETRLSEYAKIYKDKHPKMIRLKEEMHEMARKIEKSKKSAFDFDATFNELQGGDELYILEGFKANNISIQDSADVPALPVYPKKRLNVLLAVIVGLFGGAGLAFFFEYLDDTVKDIEDIEKIVEWPFLGNIPKMEGGKDVPDEERNLLTHKKPKDPVAEAYRAIRTSIIFSSTEEKPLKNIIVTSPGPQEGKTTTVCNLGIALAQTNQKALLVDADMRKPRLHEIFKKENNIGLSTFLCGKAGINDVIQKTDIENLYIVTGGPFPPNPSELLSCQKMKEFSDEVKKKFGHVFFDTPPAAIVTDATVLSQNADGIVMVMESGKTSRRALPRIYSLINDARARVIGIILNKISLTSRNYYYHYYSYYYGRVPSR